MKKTLLLLSSLFILSGNTVPIDAQNVAVSTTPKQEEKTIEVIDEVFYTSDAEYRFLRRAATTIPGSGSKDEFDLIFWVFDLTNISDEPINVWHTAMNDMEIKYENDFAITDLRDDGIYQVELSENGGVNSVKSKLSAIDLKPGSTITVLYYGQYEKEEHKNDVFFLEFSEWFNSDNTARLYQYGHEKVTDQ